MSFLQEQKLKLALWLLKSEDEKVKRAILAEAVVHLFNAISEEDILKENPDGTVQYDGKTLPANYLKDLKEQAKLLPDLLLWKVLKKDVQYQLRRKMFEEARIDLDVVWGQLLTFLWDVIEN